jgi:hypothetical protein
MHVCGVRVGAQQVRHATGVDGHSAVALPHKLWKAQCAVSAWYLWWTRFPKLFKMCIQKQWIEREACGRNKRHEERGNEAHTPNLSGMKSGVMRRTRQT